MYVGMYVLCRCLHFSHFLSLTKYLEVFVGAQYPVGICTLRYFEGEFGKVDPCAAHSAETPANQDIRPGHPYIEESGVL